MMSGILQRALSAFAAIIAAAMLFSGGSASAQTATANWSSAGAGSMTPMPNPTNITASDGTSVQMDYTSSTDGGSFVPVYGGSFVSYYSGQIGNVTGPLLLSFNNSDYDPDDRVTVIITLGRAVRDLQFSIDDIDSGSFRDAVIVEYDTGSGSFQNAANTAAFWSSGATVQRTNNVTINGWTGNGGSGTTSTNGTLAFSFGNTAVTRIRITYSSYTGSGDPTGQFAGISNLSFSERNADLSLAKALIGAAPGSGGSVTWRLTVASAATSSETATGIAVQDYLPAGFIFGSAAGSGSFDGVTGLWSVGSLASGQSVSIDITGTINATAGATITNTAEIVSSSVADPDSTPNNGVVGEDDDASRSFTVAGARMAGIPPILTCPGGSILFDWDTRTWPSGNPVNQTLAPIGTLAFDLVNPGVWLNSAAFGGQSPNLQTVMNGGTTGQLSLLELVNLPDRNAQVTTTITLPEIMRGAQFTLFDVDFGAGQFADHIIVEGRYQGATVLPVLTNGTNNYVIANSAFGDIAAASNVADANVTVTFNSSIDTIIIYYGNHSLAPTNPGTQGVALHDITFCRPTTTIAVSKTSILLDDPQNGTVDPKAIPDSTVEYCVVITNSGDTSATNVVSSDALPGNATYVAGSIRSGTSCASATTPEDDDNSGGDESDPYGASISGTTLTAFVAALAASESFALKYQMTVD